MPKMGNYGTKNESTHKGKSASLRHPVSEDSPEYNQRSSGESHSAMRNSKFCGPTKGNRDLPIDRTKGVSTGHGGGPHKAGGKNAGRKKMDYSNMDYS